MNFSFSSDPQDIQYDQKRNSMKPSEFSNIQLKEENMIIKEENESLKSQLSRVKSEIFPELENAHMKIRDLTTQLQESNKNCDNLQNRLKLSQMKCQETEGKRMEYDNKLSQLQNEKNVISSKCEENQQIINSLNQEISELKKNIDQMNSDEQQFFDRMSSFSGYQISSYSDVFTLFMKRRENRQVEIRSMNDSQEFSMQSEISPEIIEKIKSKVNKYKETVRQLLSEKQELSKQLSQKDIGFQKLKENEEIANKRLQDALSQLQEQKRSYFEKENHYDQLYQEKEILEMENSKKDGKLQDLNFQLQNIKSQITRKNEECNQLTIQLSQKSASEQELNDQIQQYKSLVNQLQENCNKASIKLNSVMKSKKHLKAKLAEVDSENKSKLSENSKKITTLELENQKLDEDNKALLSQLQAARASHIEANSAFNSVKKDSEQLEKALSLIKSIVEKQKDDFQLFAKEKESLIALIRKQSQLLTEFEKLLADENKNTRNLTNQVRKLEKENEKEKQKVIECESSIGDKCLEMINNCFTKKLENEDEIRNKFVPILVSQTSTPESKISSTFQMIIEKLKENKNLSNQLFELKQKDELIEKEIQSFHSNNDQSQSVLNATIAGFHKLLANLENLPDQNESIITFISNETEKLELLLKENQQDNPQFISMDFLFNGSLEDRKRAIQSISNEGWNANDAFSLFCVMALINICQEKELVKHRSMPNEFSQIQESLGYSSASEVISTVTNLTKKLKKAKTTNKSLLDEIQNTSIVIPQNEELQQSIQTKDQAIANLNQELERVQKENESIQQRINTLEKVKNDLKTEMHQKDENNQKSIFELEKKINEKINEYEELKTKLSLEKSTVDTLKKNLEKKDEQIKELQNENESISKRLKLKEKQNKSKIKQIVQKYEDIANELEQNKNDLESKLNASLKNEKRQNEEKEELIKRMADSLETSEKRNQKMLNDISFLNISKKALEMKIQSLIDQMKREEQMLAAKYEFKLMAEETKHQEELAKARVRFLTERDHVIIHVLNCFDELDQFGDKDISVSEFEASVTQVGKNYLELRKQK